MSEKSPELPPNVTLHPSAEQGRRREELLEQIEKIRTDREKVKQILKEKEIQRTKSTNSPQENEQLDKEIEAYRGTVNGQRLKIEELEKELNETK